MQKFKSISDKNPFKVPDNYFEEVNRKIISVTAGHEQQVLKIGIYRRFRPYLLIAASVTLLLIIGFTVSFLSNKNKAESNIAEVKYEVFSDSFLNDIDLNSIEENVGTDLLSEEGPDLTRTEIINYLLVDNIEINDIYE
jgi:hypothetical protein